MATWLIGEGRSAGVNIRARNGRPMIDETWHYVVKTDDKATTKLAASQTAGLPIVNQTLSAGGLAVCRSKNGTRRENNPYIWDFTAEFSSEVDENSGAPAGMGSSADPTTWVPVYETKFERQQVVVSADHSGTPIANSAGVSFPGGMTVVRKLPVWEFFQFEPITVTDENIIDRSETVNDDTFRGRSAKTLLLAVLHSSVGFYYGALRRLTHYSLTFKSDKWTHKRLDVGTHYLDSGVLVPCWVPRSSSHADWDNRVVVEDGLNGSGGRAAEGSPPAIREFDMYPPLDFSDFLRVAP